MLKQTVFEYNSQSVKLRHEARQEKNKKNEIFQVIVNGGYTFIHVAVLIELQGEGCLI